MAESPGNSVQLELPSLPSHVLQSAHLEALCHHLSKMRFGIEKEGLRVDANTGSLAQTPHPRALGSALTHPHITTDYSEALLEFVTGTHNSPKAAINQLEQLHIFASSVLEGERIWPLSMPCLLPDSDADIPLAYYGESHIGRLKTVYRRGLGFRYGRQMQTIAGVHFNLSFSDDFWLWRAALDTNPDISDIRGIRDVGYFRTIRNFRRIQWLIMLLTGASPSIDKSFRLLATDRFRISGRTRLSEGATSLRMSDLGYQSATQESINICFNQLDTYCNTLSEAVHQPWPTYEGLGLKDKNGFKQLNVAVLQIENEYYSSIRPKCIQQPGERPVRALINRGIEYLEVRALDLNPFAPTGITEYEASLITLLMAASALADSPFNSPDERIAIEGINARASWAGRRSDQRFDERSSLKETGIQFLAALDPIAESLNQAFQSDSFTGALEEARLRLAGAHPLLSEEIENTALKEGHLAFGLTRAHQHHDTWKTARLPPDTLVAMKKEAEQSHQSEIQITASNEGTFDAFVEAYINQP